LFCAPGGRRCFGGDETARISSSIYRQPRMGDGQVLSVAPPGLADLLDLGSRRFHRRLISVAPPAQKQRYFSLFFTSCFFCFSLCSLLRPAHLLSSDSRGVKRRARAPIIYRSRGRAVRAVR